jgi:DNA-directed RNA polymerase subunit M/transcription elongation factor TFIIS
MICSGWAPSDATVPKISRTEALRLLTLHCARIHPTRIFPRHIAASPKLVRQIAGSPEDMDRLRAWVAAAVEHGLAVWSEAKPKLYARKLYSVLWALRAEANAEPTSASALLRKFEPWELAFVREESMLPGADDGNGGNGYSGGGDDDGPSASASASSAGSGTTSLAALFEKMDALEKRLKEHITQPRRKCPRCGSADMMRIAVQTRSGDEGMTNMMQCISCHQRIRI